MIAVILINLLGFALLSIGGYSMLKELERQRIAIEDLARKIASMDSRGLTPLTHRVAELRADTTELLKRNQAHTPSQPLDMVLLNNRFNDLADATSKAISSAASAIHDRLDDIEHLWNSTSGSTTSQVVPAQDTINVDAAVETYEQTHRQRKKGK
jgi:HAMP domain-containing protein